MKSCVTIPIEYLDELELLDDAEFGRLMRGLLAYSLTGTEPELPGNERFSWKRVKNQEDRFADAYDAKCEANGKNGKKGGRPKKTASTENPEVISETGENRTVNFENPKNRTVFPETQKSQLELELEKELEPENNPPKAPQGAVAERFNRFWAIYPNKTGKQAALKAWSKLKPSEELTKVILAAVEYQKTWEKWTKENGRYVPNPATWLNQGRWEDEPPETEKKGAMESWGGNTLTGQAERETAERLRRFRDSLLDGGDGS